MTAAAPAGRLRVAVVGPTHPLKGGVAAHTTELARRLQRDGHDVELVSWSALYPRRLYPGDQEVPGGEADIAPFTPTSRPLAWNRPDSWLRAGRRLRHHDVIVVAHAVAVLAPAYLALLIAAGRRPRRVVIAHNVLPHERQPGDAVVVRALFRRADTVVVHSGDQAAEARRVAGVRPVVAAMPPHLPHLPATATGAPGRAAPPRDEQPLRLLSVGIVRHYKGLDVLLEALRAVPDVQLTIAGELWADAGAEVRRLAAHPAVAGRVTVRAGYVPAGELATLLRAHDVLVLPYRSATASQNARLGHAYGLPVLATSVGTFADDIRDAVDGMLVPPEDPAALAGALRALTDRGTLERLRSGVEPVDLDGPWRPYVTRVLRCDEQTVDAPQGPAMRLVHRAAELGLWGRVALQRRVERGRRPVPASVPPTAVLRTDRDWQRARREARRLRLPLHPDKPKNWDALGAVGAVLTLPGGDDRSARVLDAGSARYSSVLPWLRLYGLGDPPGGLTGINLEFGAEVVRDGVRFRYGDITATDFDDGSLDAVTCMSVIEHGVPLKAFLAESARILRPGGVLCVSTDYDADPPDTTGIIAYGTEVRIFGPDDIRRLVADAADVGLELVGDVDAPGWFEHSERPVRWRRTGLDYTFILLTFQRSP